MMGTKKYIKDYWGRRDLILDVGNDEVIAVGEVIRKNSEAYMHFKLKDLLDFFEERNLLYETDLYKENQRLKAEIAEYTQKNE